MPRPQSPPFTLSSLASAVDELAPFSLAESWDNVGLQIGDPSSRVRRVMTCLELTEPTLAEAKRHRVNAVVSHHPLIFRPLKTILDSRPPERLAAELIRARIGLVVAHTNLDSARWGTNQVLAERCGLRITGPLDPRELPAQFKFVIFTPEGHEAKIIDAIARGGGGVIGAYTHCTFRTPGTGTFLGGEGANPFIGKAGQFEQAAEFRIEALVPPAARASVLREVLAVHPYEEPAYEFYVLGGEFKGYGLGCIAELDAPETAGSLARRIKRKLKLKFARISGPSDRKVRRIAICTGSGGSLLARAAALRADALLTGEANYHAGIEAHQRGIAMIEIGHYESEQIVAEPLAKKLSEMPALKAAGVEVIAATQDLQPYQFL
jgi:dinuclear metal center YbgI/SA1388 family protein